MVRALTNPNGWAVYSSESSLQRWAAEAGHLVDAALREPAYEKWYRSGRTWFVGVDCLPNDEAGSWHGGPPLTGAVVNDLPSIALHPAQTSVIFPGYPEPSENETEAAFRFRLTRDGAHVDGILPIGTERRRMVREPHAYVLGIALNDTDAGASPLVAWKGSHRVMGQAFRTALLQHAKQDWPNVDVTEIYQRARRTVFKTCERVELHLPLGAAVLLHPMTVHGIAPWVAADGPPRKMAYFRPMIEIDKWLRLADEA